MWECFIAGSTDHCLTFSESQQRQSSLIPDHQNKGDDDRKFEMWELLKCDMRHDRDMKWEMLLEKGALIDLFEAGLPEIFGS